MRSGPGHGTNTVPFSRDAQLSYKLVLDNNGQLQPTNTVQPWLPGYPRVALEQKAMVACIRSELTTPTLDAMHPYLWLVASQASHHVSSLTEQLVRGRQIVVTENPELHLTWANTRVYIKPIPEFLLSYDFWSVCLSATPLDNTALAASRRASLGYLRTYFHLIRHKSDFIIAQQSHLVPEDVDFVRLITFLTPFGSVPDGDVSLRYQFGQLRLTRLNLWAPLALHRFYFHKVQWQYADVFAQFYAPVLLIFGFLSIVLAAMQVGTQARPEWGAFASVSAWFAVTSLLAVLTIGVAMAVLLLTMLLRELVYSLKIKLK